MDKGAQGAADRAVGTSGDPVEPVAAVTPSAVPTPQGVAVPSQRAFAKPHAIEGIMSCGSHLALRLWAVDATQFIRIIVRIGGQVSKLARVTTLFYTRDDITKTVPGAVGLTILLRDPGLQEGAQVEILLVTIRDEILVARGPMRRAGYNDFFAALVYDIQRTGRPIEQRLLFDRTRGLSDLLQSSWAEYLSEKKQAFLTFGKAYRPASFSVITVFYRRPFIVSLYAFTARILDLPADAEVILCFQQGSMFQREIDHLEGLFRMFQINHRFILLEDNIGFAAANNIGVEHAQSSRILLVNPDICCNDPAIYAKLAYSADDGAIYGATLLSDADEVMHNGIELLEQTISFKNKAQRVLRTSHVGRHMPVDLIEEGAVTGAEAVSGAIIAVSRGSWDRLGGLPEHFIFAHFEDIEFCRMATRTGLAIKVYQTRQLIHLESYGSGEDSLLNAIKQVNSAIFNMGAA